MNVLKGVREYLTPVRGSSAFIDKGVLTPEEFVASGDQLVFKCPTWSWEAGDPTKAKPYLPPDKQFLVTRNVPCHRRAFNLENDYLGDTEVEGGEAGGDGECWIEPNVLTEAQRGAASAGESASLAAPEKEYPAIAVPELSKPPDATSDVICGLGAAELKLDHFQVDLAADAAEAEAGSSAAAVGGSAGEEDAREAPAGDEYLDLDTFVQDNVMEPDQATLHTAAYVTAVEPEDNILHTRTYDLSITYDKYYQTPRIWLFGYDELQQPLSGEQIFEDVMQDYVRQTVTLEMHPHLGAHQASVHPCRHAAVMKRIVDNVIRGGKTARVDHYLFIFLKFIQSVVPTVNYDFTADSEF